MIVLTPAGHSGMEEHLLAQVLVMESAMGPPPLFLKVGISIQLPFCLPHRNILGSHQTLGSGSVSHSIFVKNVDQTMVAETTTTSIMDTATTCLYI